MQQDGVWVDGMPWGEGTVVVAAIAYLGTLEGHSPQYIAYASDLVLKHIIARTPAFLQVGAQLVPFENGLDFVAIGWQQPICTWAKPRIDRSN